ncbi:hypothetical protein MKA58_11805 [[Clostridium] innocuum]|nr:hypothetical protein [[Clostridium] innocuum]
MKKRNWVDDYLETGEYIGNYKRKTDKAGCPLSFKEINNFIQNAGKYGDLVIYKKEDNDYLLSTVRTQINEIWPLEQYKREELRDAIHYIEQKLDEQIRKEGYYPKPLSKVSEFVNTAMGFDFSESQEMEETEPEESQGIHMNMK